MPDNTLQEQDEGIITMWPVVWAPGHSYNVTISGTYPITDNCTDTEVSISAWEWPDAPDYYQVGPADPNIHLSGLTWVSPTETTFNVSVDEGEPTGSIFFSLRSTSGFENFWQVSIQNPPPPSPPSPPQGPSLPCPTPTLDAWLVLLQFPCKICTGNRKQLVVQGTVEDGNGW